MREDPLRVDLLLAEAEKGRLPMPVVAELATATAAAAFSIADKRGRLTDLVDDAKAAKERADDEGDKEKHEKREQELSAQRDEAQGQLDWINVVAQPNNENAMAALVRRRLPPPLPPAPADRRPLPLRARADARGE